MTWVQFRLGTESVFLVGCFLLMLMIHSYYICFAFCTLFVLELVNSEDPTLNFITNNPLDALLAVEIEPQKEFLLCFNRKLCLLPCLKL